MRPFRRLWFANPEGRCRWRRLTRRCLVVCLETLGAVSATGNGHARPYRMKTTAHCLRLFPAWQEISLRGGLERLHRRTHGFLHALEAPAPGGAATPHRLGFELAAFLGLGFLPQASAAGRWDRAAQETASFLRLVAAASAVHRLLPPGTRRTYLRLLAVPVLWSLCATVADLEEGAGRPATRTERLHHGWAVAEVFQALDRLADSPPSLYFAAGVLAAVIGPPSAREWINRAHRQARARGARSLGRFFDRLVTPPRPGPSGE